MRLTAPTFFLGLCTSSVLGSSCRTFPCGRVNNGSPYRLKWADLERGSDRCQVYNWHGGKGGETWDSVNRPCKQGWVNAGDDKGGYFNDRIDVDGFCYHDRQYKIQWGNGRRYTIPAGVWTKIASSQTALCKDVNGDGTPECYIA